MIRSGPTAVCRLGRTGASVAYCAAFLLMGTAVPMDAQVSAGMRAQDIGINAAIGFVTAAAWSLVRGHSVSDGFSDGVSHGLVGGAAIGVGRQVAASPFSGSGFTGREISAMGISLITSAGSEHVRLSFPIGPAELQLVDGHALDWRVNATDAIAVAITAAQAGTRLDASLSLASGTFVFRDRHETLQTSSGEAAAAEFFQSITLSRAAFDGGSGVPRVLYHENVHVLQDDYLADAITSPIESAWLSRTAIGKRIARHIDLGLLSLPINVAANGIIPYSARPWEREAFALTPLHNY